MLEIVEEQRLPIPRPLAKLALSAMKRSVHKRAGFDIGKVSSNPYHTQPTRPPPMVPAVLRATYPECCWNVR